MYREENEFFKGLLCGLGLGICFIFMLWIKANCTITEYKKAYDAHIEKEKKYVEQVDINHRLDMIELMLREFIVIEEIKPEDLTNPIPEWKNPNK